MEKQDLIAKVASTIDTPVVKVQDPLTDPKQIKKYMFGATVASDSQEGSAISWKGIYEGKVYEDKGKILQLKPSEFLQYTHFSPLSGKPDIPESYHTVTIHLSKEGSKTKLSLEQDKNEHEKEREGSEKNWKRMLDGIKKLLEEKR